MISYLICTFGFLNIIAACNFGEIYRKVPAGVACRGFSAVRMAGLEL